LKILVTGAKGFIGKNLIAELKNRGFQEILTYTKDDDPALLKSYAKVCDFVFHLAGVNRPIHEAEFMEGNYGFTEKLLRLLKEFGNQAPIVAASSIQAKQDHPYGKSKRAMEDALFLHESKTGAKVYVYRLPNVFGKWSRPDYNSVVATYCHHIARNLPIHIHHAETELTLCYIDDLLDEFLNALKGSPAIQSPYCTVPLTYQISLGDLASLLESFKANRENLHIANMEDGLTKKLYSTYVSFLPENQFAYNLQMHLDQRGSFTEFLRTPDRGQVSVNVSKPGITKGNHWHHSKNEKFLVVSGEGIIRFRKPDCTKIIEYHVSGEKMQVVDIPAGYTHSIVNIGQTDLVTVIWVNECFNPEKPDTYYLEV
jgi:UDP-2-acetamido-2,6-beta-L-arabino-hexul-4-ose reductase